MFFLNTNVTVSKQVDLFVEGMLALSEASFDPFDLPEPDIEATANISPDNPASTADYDYSGIGDYSDLDFSQLEATVGLKYKLANGSKLYGSVNIMDVKDDQPYVYGSFTSTLLTYAAGWSVGF